MGGLGFPLFKNSVVLTQWLVVIGEGGNNSKNGFRRVHPAPPGWYDNLGLIYVNYINMCLVCCSLKLYKRTF